MKITKSKSIGKIVGIIACLTVMAFAMTACAGPVGPAGPAGTNGISIVWKGALAAPPANPVENWAYYNTADGIAYIYNGSAWVILVQDGAVGPSNVYTVTFDTGEGGSAMPAQKVLETQLAYDPTATGIYPEPTRTIQLTVDDFTFSGLYAPPSIMYWYYGDDDTEPFNFYSTPITADITLKAKWSSDDAEYMFGISNIDDAIDYINTNYASEWLYVLGGDEGVSSTGTLSKDDTKLTIIGKPGPIKSIYQSMGIAGEMFILEGENVSLTIGDKVNLKGPVVANNVPLVSVYPTTTFIMLEGSAISDNSLPGTMGTAGAVTVEGGTFIMKGGSISGIEATCAVDIKSNHYMGTNYYGSFVMEGGSIGDNDVGIPGFVIDVSLDRGSSFTLSGDAAIEGVLLQWVAADTEHPTSFSPITIDPTWLPASPFELYLMGTDGDFDDIDELKAAWDTQTVLKTDTALTPAQLEKVELGKFIFFNGMPPEAEVIDGSIDTAGVLTLTLD